MPLDKAKLWEIIILHVVWFIRVWFIRLFFWPSTGFPEKSRVPSTGSGRPKGFRKYVSIEAQAHPQHLNLYLRQMNTQVRTYIMNARDL